MRRSRLIILLLFFLSGATALVYQVLWTRTLTLIFGSTVFAISTVLTAFMAGLALGSFYFGRWADRSSHPLRLYAYFEVGIGVFALIYPLVPIMLQALYVVIHRQLGSSFYLLSLIRFVFAFLILLVPTTLMGATLPALSKFFVARKQQLGWDVGRLYSVNTFGAVVGTLAAAFFLTETLGVIGSLYLAALINLMIAGIALWLNRASEDEQRTAETKDPEARTKRRQSNEPATKIPLHVRVALLTFGVSGFCALSYEILWTRILVFFLGSTTYAFATMLAAFLFGIAFGSFLFGKIADSQRRLIAILAFTQIAIGLFAILLLPAFAEIYAIRAYFSANRVGAFLACVSVMLLPTFLMGASFPLIARIYTLELPSLGTLLGRVYAINTLGAILGSFVGGFLLIPWFGIQRSVVLVATINMLMGTALYAVDPESQKRSRGSVAIAVGLLVVLGFLLIPADKPIVLKSAIFQYDNPGGRLLWYEEEVDATVTAIEDSEGVRRLYVDTNQAAEDSRWDSPSHRVIAHLPLLLHPRPRRALVVGFGMGVTSYSITQHRVRVDAVEISPGVVHANRFFTKANQNILENPLLSMTIDDGRNFILTTEQRYDMISTGIIHPLVSSGSSNIYTKDFYELSRRILTEDGIMCQWVPLHRLPESHYKTIIRTFMEVFPNTTLWYKFTPDFVILIGTPQPLRIDYQRFMARSQIRSIAEGLAHDDLDGLSLLDSFMMGPDELREYVGQAPIHTDNRPRLEFFKSRELVNTTYHNIKGMQPYRASVLPYLTNTSFQERQTLQRYFQATQQLIQGQLAYVQGHYEEAAETFRQAVQANPADKTLQYNLSAAVEYGLKESDAALSQLESELQAKLLLNPRDAKSYGMLGLAYQTREQWDKAVDMLEKSLKYDPNQGQIHASLYIAYGGLAVMYEEKGEIRKAITAVKKAIRLEPNLWLGHSWLGSLYQNQGQYEQAIAAFQKALSLEPGQPRIHYALAMSYRDSGRMNDAIQELQQSVDADYAPAMILLARLILEQEGEHQKAIDLANRVLQQDPNIPAAYDILALAYVRAGDRTKAREMIQKAIRLNPGEPLYQEHRRMIEGSE